MRPTLIELWKENHGIVLLATLVAILIVGASILGYEQYRFKPVRFPDGNLLQGQDRTTFGSGEDETLLVEITNAENDLGSIMVAIFDNEEAFSGKTNAIIRQTLPINDQRAEWSIPLEALPDRFVVSAFHDANDDHDLNTNMIGIPTERYGFSRDARGTTGPPNFADAVIDRPVSKQSITIKLQ